MFLVLFLSVCYTERLLEDHDSMVESVMLLLQYHDYVVSIVVCVLYRAPARGPRLYGGECDALVTVP